MLDFFAIVAGIILILLVLWETFETIVLPRRVTRQFRITRYFYRLTWSPCAFFASRYKNRRKRDARLSYYGPISLLLLLGFWAIGLMVGFALIYYGGHIPYKGELYPNRFANDLYVSGTTLVTLGLGDLAPGSPLGRFLTVVEAGLGFGFLALVVGYLPVLYQAFSRREVTISLLDARAGSPPTATELLRRHSGEYGQEALFELLKDWERWSADLMESHLSYPVLAYFRSQHDNQSWLASLTTILDVCALSLVAVEGMCEYQARMTFAIARHALVDLSQVFNARPVPMESFDRLPSETMARMRQQLREQGVIFKDGDAANNQLTHLRSLYEPYAIALSRFLCMDLPPWVREGVIKDNWKTTAWQPRSALARQSVGPEDHF